MKIRFLYSIILLLSYFINLVGQKPSPPPPPPVFESVSPFSGEQVEQFEENNKIGFRIATTKEIVLPAQFDEMIGYDYGNLMAMRKGDKYGYVNQKGAIVVPIAYDDIKQFHIKSGPIKKGGKWGFVNSSNKIVIPFEYDDIGTYYDYVAVKKKKKWGIINKKNEWIIQPKYQDLKLLSHSFRAKKSKKWGYFDYKGKQLTKYKYHEVSPTYTMKNFYKARIGTKWGYINEKGKEVIPIAYEAIAPYYFPSRTYENGFKFKVQKGTKWGIIPLENPDLATIRFDSINEIKGSAIHIIYLDGKAGFINKFGEIIIAPKFEEVLVNDYYSNPIPQYLHHKLNVRIGNNWGALDKDGQIIQPLSKQYIPKHLAYFIKWEDGKYGVLKNGEIVIPFVYDKITPVSDTTFLITKKINGTEVGKLVYPNQEAFLTFDYTSAKNNGGSLITIQKDKKYGAVNAAGEIIIPFKYDYLDAFTSKEVTKVEKERQWGVINSKGEIIIPIAYDYIDEISLLSDFIEVSKDNLSGYFDITGQEVIPVVYNSIYGTIRSTTKFCFVEKDNKIGCVNLKGEVIIPLDYDEYEHNLEFELGDEGTLIQMRKGEYWELLNNQGQTVVANAYEKITAVKDSLVPVQQSGLWGISNLKNELPIPTKYEQIKIAQRNKIFIKTKNKWGVIDNNGHLILPTKFDNLGDYINTKKLMALLENKWYLITEDTKSAISEGYDAYKIASRKRNKKPITKIAVQKNDKWGFINISGKLIIPLIYDNVRDFFDERMIRVNYQGKGGHLMKDGKFHENN